LLERDSSRPELDARKGKMSLGIKGIFHDEWPLVESESGGGKKGATLTIKERGGRALYKKTYQDVCFREDICIHSKEEKKGDDGGWGAPGNS